MVVLAKTALIVCVSSVLCTSCTTSRVVGDTQTPEVEVEFSGIVWVGDRQVAVGKIGRALKSAGVSRDEAVKVLVADRNDRVLMRAISSDLVMSGFKRPIFITDKKTQSSIQQDR